MKTRTEIKEKYDVFYKMGKLELLPATMTVPEPASALLIARALAALLLLRRRSTISA